MKVFLFLWLLSPEGVEVQVLDWFDTMESCQVAAVSFTEPNPHDGWSVAQVATCERPDT